MNHKKAFYAILIMAAALAAYAFIPGYFKKQRNGDEMPSKEFSTKIITGSGELSLKYKEGIATLSGTLSRPTPCVDWRIKTSGSEDFPPSHLQFSIADKNEGRICIQVLGKPQQVFASARASEKTIYTVNFGDETVFEGKLDAQTATPDKFNESELKYDILSRFGEIFFCDPDFYPVGRDISQEELAQNNFNSIKNNINEYEAIIKNNSIVLNGNEPDLNQKVLIYQEHKKLRAVGLEPFESQYKFRITLGEEEKGEVVEGTISKEGQIKITKREPSFATCPICLAENVLIDTPGGKIKVQYLKEGMTVWTADESVNKVEAVVIKTSQTRVPQNHKMIRAALQDGREVLVSAGHPTSDGRKFANLKIGDILDGSKIANIETLPYKDSFTYDILPSGKTGFYWANGILIGSTLK